ncbi:unnamed protein product [Rodentolepis nana]|uniref:Peptidase_S8 domain-containing protein n=1 Tax=Rodentolepis nana TaxID=102285 RepID=A0A0R3TSR7_RODNA|nr:unnamed protein product [Rodentolepis nana]
MSFIYSSKLTSLLIIFTLSVTGKNHFVITGFPSVSELDYLINFLGLEYRSRGSLGSDLHYFITTRTGDSLLELYETILTFPWVRIIEHQYPLYIQKKSLIYNSNSDESEAPVQLIELPNDDEYRLVYEHHAKLLIEKLKFNDPNAPYMWQLLNSGNKLIGKTPGIDINAYPVYAANITGKNVMAVVVDDALDTTHEDLSPNINSDYLADLQNDTRLDARGTDAKMPKSQDHGTEVAGLYAAVANNSKCAFGVAYDAKLGGELFNRLIHLIYDIIKGASAIVSWS